MLSIIVCLFLSTTKLKFISVQLTQVLQEKIVYFILELVTNF